MICVVAGATGAVGSRILYWLSQDERCAEIRALVRSSDHEISQLQSDVPKCSVNVVDFDKLEEQEPGRGDDADVFHGCHAGLSALGMYQSDARDELHMRAVEVQLNARVARHVRAGGATRYAFLSVGGITSRLPIVRNSLACRVKLEAEEAIRGVFEHLVAIRPGGIVGRESKVATWSDRVSPWIPKFMHLTVHVDDVARAMVESVLRADTSEILDVYEFEEVDQLASTYNKT